MELFRQTNINFLKYKWLAIGASQYLPWSLENVALYASVVRQWPDAARLFAAAAKGPRPSLFRAANSATSAAITQRGNIHCHSRA